MSLGDIAQVLTETADTAGQVGAQLNTDVRQEVKGGGGTGGGGRRTGTGGGGGTRRTSTEENRAEEGDAEDTSGGAEWWPSWGMEALLWAAILGGAVWLGWDVWNAAQRAGAVETVRGVVLGGR